MQHSMKTICAIMVMLLIAVRGFSLTNGPIQPEFSSFEPVDASDLVNLPTGDFSYVLPLGDVKGSAGVGYPVVLSYHAGIMHEQEATWTGLGWSLNVGAINRGIRVFPDDYSGDDVIQYLYDDGEHGWSLDVGGGWGPVYATTGFSYSSTNGHTWDGLTSVGFGYNIGIAENVGISAGVKVDVRNGTSSGGVTLGYHNGTAYAGVGLTFGSDQEPEWVAGGGLKTAFGSFSLSTKGGGYSLPGSNGSSFSMALGKGGLYHSSAGLHATFPLPFGARLDIITHHWRWYYAQMEYGSAYGYLYQAGSNASGDVTTYNKVYYNAFSPEAENDPGTSPGTVLSKKKAGGNKLIIPEYKRVNFEHIADRLEYIKGEDINLPSQDVYNIASQGIGGVFQPFAYHATRTCYSSDTKKDGIIGKPVSGNGTMKYPYSFEKKDDNGNIITTYFNNHKTEFSDEFHNGFTFKMIGERSLNLVDYCDFGYAGQYSNIDLITENNVAKPRNTFGTKIEPIFGLDEDFPGKLSGFIVTDQEGKTYYYTLPLFSLHDVKYVNDASKPPLSDGVLTFGKDHSYRANLVPYATTWLLTSITGPDYIKMQNNENWSIRERLLPHDGDLGYWVVFNYNYGDPVKNTVDGVKVVKSNERPEKCSYRWRVPYYDSETHPNYPYPHLTDKCNKKYSSNYGMKEITYLKSIETSAEVAYFRTNERLDGLGVDEKSYPKFVPTKINPNDIEGKYTNYGIVSEGKYRYHMIIQRASGGPENLGNCFRITLNKKVFDTEKFENLKNGEKVARVSFKTKKYYKRHWFLLGQGLLSRTVYGDLELVKETHGNTYNNDGTIKSFNCSMHPDRIYGNAVNDGKIATHYAKCFYVHENPKNKDEVIIYATSFSHDDHWYSNNDGSVYISYWRSAIRYRWTEPDDDLDWYWTPTGTMDLLPTVESGWVSGAIELYATRNPITRYQKKLDAIAWYSKAEYPFITCKVDPIDVKGKKYYPNDIEPKAYRQVKLHYNYECAPGTHNSVAWNKGRLTLKAVQVEAGKGEETVKMPPYFFTYQNPSVKYLGHDKVDPWGFQKNDPNTTQNISSLGVNWNLSKIALPSGGAIEIEYERDHCYSSLASIYRIKREHPCLSKNEIVPDGSYFIERDVEQYDPVDLRIYVDKVEELSKGSYFIAFFADNYTEDVDGLCGQAPNPFSPITHKNTFKGEYESCVYKIVKTIPELGCVIIDRKIVEKPGKFRKIRILKKANMRCDGVRVKKIITDPGVIGKKQYTVYAYPKPGVLPLLPEAAIPSYLNENGSKEKLDCSYDKLSGTTYNYERTLDFMPYSPDIGKNYSAGNRSIIYPMVDVYQANKDGEKINGYKRFHFWTADDEVKINNENVPLISIYELKNVWYGGKRYDNHTTITDRSSIIGMTKKLEFWNNEGTTLVYQKNNHFTFSQELAKENTVIYNSFDNKLELKDKKPLGLINERSLRVDTDGNIKSIAEIIRSVPFLVGVTEKNDNITRNVEFGMFDARTGSHLVTVSENSDKQQRLDLNVPYRYVTNGYREEDLRKKNIHNLQAGKLTANISHINNDLSSLTYADIISDHDSIKIATAQDFREEIYSNAPFKQNRYMLSEFYNWKGNADFEMPMQNNANWLKTKRFTRIDKYGRPQGIIDATGKNKCFIYHPRLNTATAIISNAKYYESGVYTCDYMEKNTLHQGYADYENGWEINVGNPNGIADPLVEPCVLKKHFGNKSLFVQNSFGPTCNFKVSKLHNYILSAWVKISSGPFNLNVEYRSPSKNGEINNWPIKLNQLGTIYAIDVTTKNAEDAENWTYVELEVKTKEKLTSNIGYVRAWVGNPNGGNAYIDDIRFYPKDALVESYYYDQELGKPITIVDPNNKARHYEYDQFGRLTAVRNSAQKLVKKAEYSQSKFLTIITPNGGEEIQANHQYKIKWTYLQSIEDAKVEISLGKNVGSDNEVWFLINDINGTGAILVPAKNGEFNWWPKSGDVGNNCKIKIELMESDFEDRSDNKFSIYIDD